MVHYCPDAVKDGQLSAAASGKPFNELKITEK